MGLDLAMEAKTQPTASHAALSLDDMGMGALGIRREASAQRTFLKSYDGGDGVLRLDENAPFSPKYESPFSRGAFPIPLPQLCGARQDP